MPIRNPYTDPNRSAVTIAQPAATHRPSAKSARMKLNASSNLEHDDDITNDVLLYGDFLKNDERVYQPLSNWNQIVSVLSEYQMRSNMAGHVTKQIVFFKEAVEHICRYVLTKTLDKKVNFLLQIIQLNCEFLF